MMSIVPLYLSLFAAYSYTVSSETNIFGRFRKFHTHPLESQDFPFAPGQDEFILGGRELIEPYEDITNETALYFPLIRKYVNKMKTRNDSMEGEKNFDVEFAGWKSTELVKTLLLQFKVNKTGNSNSEFEEECDVVMETDENSDIYELKRHRCRPSRSNPPSEKSVFECYGFAPGIERITVDIFYPDWNPNRSELIPISCPTEICTSVYILEGGIKTFTEIGCGDSRNHETSTRVSVPGCIRDENRTKCECRQQIRCNDPFEIQYNPDPIVRAVTHYLNQVVQRLEKKLSRMWGIL